MFVSYIIFVVFSDANLKFDWLVPSGLWQWDGMGFNDLHTVLLIYKFV